MKPINVASKFESFKEHWTPKIIGQLNGQYVKLAKLTGEFVWHSHENEDELFMVVKGELTMHFRDRAEVVRKGEIIIVPRGVEHFPVTRKDQEVWVMLFEPMDTKHTGDVEHERTVHDQDWI